MLCKPASTKAANKHCTLVVRQTTDKEVLYQAPHQILYALQIMFGGSIDDVWCISPELALSDAGPKWLLPDFDMSENELELAKRLAERGFGFRWIEVGIG